MKKIYFITFALFSILIFSQKEEISPYYKLKKKYENYPENDKRAFRYLKQSIALAKKEKNYPQLVQGYKDAVFYAPFSKDKLKYADSSIVAALYTKNNDIISDAHLGKGIIYYFYYKKYKPALAEYLRAYQYSENSKNNYLKNEIIYHLGIVKNYLGYYASALEHFQKANHFFYEGMPQQAHPNVIFNYKKGYYNSLHRIVVCHRKLKQFKTADSINDIGLSHTKNHPDYKQEYAYFLKEKGIEKLRQNDFEGALSSLQKSIKPLSEIKDFSGNTVNFFYIGKSYLSKKSPEKAVIYFKKVDSVFQKHHFILPELRENYELLIKFYKDIKDHENELYYTKQLLKADRIIAQDFAYLSYTIHKEYDTRTLIKEKERLEVATSWAVWIIVGLGALAATLMIIIVIKNNNERKVKINYRILESNILNNIYKESQVQELIKTKDEEKSLLNEDLIGKILAKLECFEEKCGFIENGLTIKKLAHKLQTNSNYLSQIIKEHKGVNFTRYLSELRINYITNKLYTDKTFLNYKIKTLAEKCGIASRTNFSNLFQEINGMRPTEFIKKRQKDQALQSEKPVENNDFNSDQTSLSRPNLSKED